MPQLSPKSDRPLVLVTGASSGIGYELARRFAEEGFELLIVAKSDRIRNAADHLQGCGVAVEAVQADLTKREGVESVHRRVQELGRPIDVLVVNAGVGFGEDFPHDANLESELDLIHLNVVSAVHLTKRIIPEMIRRKQGRVLFTSSISALSPFPFEAVHGASKAFIRSFANSLRDELEDTGVTVTSLDPGTARAGFFRRARAESAEGKVKYENEPSDAASQGYDAVMEGRADAVAASLKTKLRGAAGRVLPERIAAKIRRRHPESRAARR